MARVLGFLIRYFGNYYTLHRSDLAARAAPLDPRLPYPIRLYSTLLIKSEYIGGVCNKTFIPLMEPVHEVCNYHFYHFAATSFNSIILSNKRACHVTFFYSLFTTKKKENQKLHWSII